jgi:hypothetical protein
MSAPIGHRLILSPSETVVWHPRRAARHADDDPSCSPTSHEPLPTFACPSRAPWPAGASGPVHRCTHARKMLKSSNFVQPWSAPVTRSKLPNWTHISFHCSEIRSDQRISKEPNNRVGRLPRLSNDDFAPMFSYLPIGRMSGPEPAKNGLPDLTSWNRGVAAPWADRTSPVFHPSIKG